MERTTIGLLHPGAMGAGIAGELVKAGHHVLWCSAGRQLSSHRRAETAGLRAVATLDELVASCEVIVSICPPHAALTVARDVAGFGGLYLDANAIAPTTAREVAHCIEHDGGRYVDGGIIGTPPDHDNMPHLSLSGPFAEEALALFAATAIPTRVLSDEPTAASALKLCYAAVSKGTMALLLDARALARKEGVEEELVAEWQATMPELVARSIAAAHQAATKGWRWVGEMEEIAAAFSAAGLPDGFHRAAGSLYGLAERDEAAGRDEETLERVLSEIVAATSTQVDGR